MKRYRFTCHRCGFRTRWRALVWIHDLHCRFPGHSWTEEPTT